MVIAGGPCAFNPEPLAEIFDFVVLGEAEECSGINEAFWGGKRTRASDRIPRRGKEMKGLCPFFFPRSYQAGGSSMPSSLATLITPL